MRSVGLLLKVLWSPAEAMFLISKNPRALVPIVFLALCSLAGGMLVMAKVPASELAMRAIERSPQGANLSDEQKDRIRQGINSPVARVLGIISAILGPILIVLIVASVYFGIFTIVGREGSFKAFFAITAFAFVPLIFRQGAAVLSAFVVPASSIMPDELGSLSPAVFLDRDSVSRVVFATVNMIDVVSLWTLCLLVIGYGFVTRKNVSKAACAGTVFGVFLVYAVIRVMLASLRGF
jgi:hypothetical protein